MALDEENYKRGSKALRRYVRDVSLEQLSAECKLLDEGKNMADTWTGIAGAFAAVAGIVLIPGLLIVMGGVMLGMAVGKGLLGDASIERDCADVPFKELEQRLDKKFNEVNRKLDQQAEILKGISEKVSETLSQLQLTREEMKAGFERVLTSITLQDINDIISNIENARTSLTFSEDGKKEANKEEYINIIKQEIGNNFLFNYVKQQGTLFEALFSIMNKKYAIPSSLNDQNAYNVLSALNYGTLTYASIVFSLLDQYAYISEYYYQTNELEEFNKHLDKLLFYFNTFKRILNANENGLIDKVVNLLESAKNGHDMKNSKNDLYKTIEDFTVTLRQLKKKISEMSLPVIDKAPENDIDISFTNHPGKKRSNTPFLDWKKGSKVSYALQFESGGKYSKISKWTQPQEVMNIASPDIRLKNTNSMNRLVFRKFDDNPPQLIRIVSGNQRAFRDVDRDLYNLATVESYQDSEISNHMNKLINMGANVKAVFENKRNVIHAAAQAGRVSMLRTILDKERTLIDVKDSIGYTPLHTAVESKEEDVAKELIKRKADVNAKTDTYHLTPLHLAVRYQLLDTVKELLSSRNIKPNEQDKFGMTPLHISVSDKSFDTAILSKLLHHQKVDPNIKDTFGLTPLHYSAVLGLYQPTKLFYQTNNVNMFPKDNKDMTPLHYAAMNGHEEIIEDLISKDRYHILDRAGEREWSPVHFAVFFKHSGCVVELMSAMRIFTIDIPDKDKQTPLHLAAASGQSDIVQILLLSGNAKVYAKTKKGYTPLDLAIVHGKKDVIKMLLTSEEHQTTPEGKSAKAEDTRACDLAKGDVLALLVKLKRCTGKYRRATDNEKIGDNNNRQTSINYIRSTLDAPAHIVHRNSYVINALGENGNEYIKTNPSSNRIKSAAAYSSYSKPKENLDKKTSTGLKTVDVNGALLLLDLFIRRFTNEKYSSGWVSPTATLDARARALNITESLGKFMESIGDGKNFEDLNLFEAYSKIYKAVLSGNDKGLVSTLCYYLKDVPYAGSKRVFLTKVLNDNSRGHLPGKGLGNFQNLISRTCY